MSMNEATAGDEDSYMDYAGDSTQPTTELLSALTAAVSSSEDNQMKEEPQEQIPPPSEYDVLTAQLAENPHNPEAWRRLVHVAEDTRDLEKISTTYDALLKQYPNNVCTVYSFISYLVRFSKTIHFLFELHCLTSEFPLFTRRQLKSNTYLTMSIEICLKMPKISSRNFSFGLRVLNYGLSIFHMYGKSQSCVRQLQKFYVLSVRESSSQSLLSAG